MANKRKTVTTPEGPGGPGGQELPGNNFMDAICGALGALAYGDSAIKNQSDLMGAVGQQSKLYSILESLNKSNKGEDKNKLVSVETSTFMKDMGQVMKNNITDPLGEHFLTINENLLNTGNQIRDFIENYDYVTNIFDNINNTLSCIEEGLRDRENLPEVKISSEITGSNNLPELIESIKNINSEELKNIYKNINEAIQLLNNADVIKAKESLNSVDEILSSIVKIGKFLKDKDKIDELNTKIRDVKVILKNNIGDLFTTLNGLAKDNNNVNESTIALAQLLGSLITVISIDQSKVSAKGIKILRNLLRKNGPIDGIFNELKRINEDSPKVSSDITKIFGIVSSFQNLGKIGYFAAINVRRGLRILSDFIKSEFEELFTVIYASGQEAEKKKEIDIQTLIDTIDLITKIGETKVDLREVRRRMYRISDVISKSVTLLFNAINKLSIEAGEGVQNTNAIISSIDSILSIITSINDIKNSVIENAGDKIHDISELFKTSKIIEERGEIHNLIDNLNKLTTICENADENMYKITDVFDSISVLFGTIPGFVELLKTSFKLELLSESIESINDMITGNTEEKITGISNIKINNQEIHKVITAVNNIINFINSINENLSEDGLNKLIKKNQQIITLLNVINKEFILINTIEPVDEDKLKSIEEVILSFSEFGSIGTAINTINDDSLTKINTLLEIIKSLSGSLLYVNDIKKLKIKENDLDSAVEAINQINIITNLITDSVSKDQADKIKNKSAEICALCDIFNAIAIINKVGKAAKPGLVLLESSAKKINDIIGIFNEIDIEKVKAATQMMNAFAKLMIISAAVLIVGALAMTFVDVENLMTFGITLGAFMFVLTKSISNLGKEITNSFNVIEDFTRLVVASAAVLLLGGLVMSIIDTGNLLLFGVTLLGFVWTLTKPFKSFTENSKEAMEGIHDFTIFVVASAVVLILGGLIMGAVKVSNLLIFTGILFTFVTAMCLPFWLFNKTSNGAMEGMHDFTIFVVASAAVLILGSLIMSAVDVGNLLIFTGTLFTFVISMILPFWLFNKTSKGAMKGMKDFSIFIAASAAVLIFGSLIMSVVDTSNLLIFTTTLAGFITAVTAPIFLFNKTGKNAMKGMKEFTIFVVASATVLLLGSMLMDHINMLNLIAFTTILAGFIFGITKAVSSNSKGIRQAAKPLLMMMGVVVASATVLLLGSWAMDKIDPINVGLFTIILGGFMLGMVGMLKIVNKASKNIFIGIAALGAMTIIVGLSASALMVVGKVMRENDLGSLLGGVGIIALVIVGIAGIAMGLGAIVTSGIGGAILWAGIGAMGAVVGIAVMASVALLSIGKAMKIMTEIGPFDTSAMIGNISSLLGLVAALAPVGALAPLIIPASIAMTMMSTTMSKIAQTVKDYAELKIPLYEGTKIVGYRHLEKRDFESAAENVKCIITTLGKAVIDVYDMNLDMFAQPTGFLGFGGGDSKFDRVVKSVSALGKLMSNICTGVQSYANLVYPIEWNAEGKAIKYKSMKSSDIVKAGENIKEVIITMSSAIIETYDMNPDMFAQPTGFLGFGKGDSKFDKVMKSVSALGKLMSNICTGVQSYANLAYPIEWNSEGKAIKYKSMKPSDIVKAGENIKEVIITMSSAIIETYDMNPNMFAQPSGFLGFGKGDSKFDKVMKSVSALGKLMGEICTGVQSYANLVYPIEWNSEGKAIKYKSMKPADITKSAETIKKVILTMSSAIIETYDTNRDMFEEPSAGGIAGFFGKKDKSKFSKVMGTIGALSILMKDICTSLQAYAKLQYPIEWNAQGQAIKFDNVDVVKAGENIQVVIKTLSQAIFDVYDKNPDMFEEPSAGGIKGFFGKKEKSKFAKVMGSIGGLSALVLDISKALQNYASMQIPCEWNGEGIAIKYLTIDNTILQNVNTNIGTIIKSLAQALIDTYNENSEMFEEPSASGLGGFLGKKEKSKMGKIMSSIAGLGNLVANIGQGVKDFATMQYACDWDANGNPIKYVKVGDAEFKAAAQNIGTVITVIGNALIDIYRKSPGGMFDDEVVKTGFIIKRAKKLEGTSPMAKTIKALSGMGGLVASLAGGVKDFAIMQYPDQWDDQGNPIHYVKLTTSEQRAAIENIGHTITTVGNALISVYQGKSWKDMIMAKECVVPMINNISGSIGKIAIGVRQFAINQVPTWYNKDGKPMDPVTVDYKAAANTVGMVITTIGKTLIDVAEGEYGWDIKQAIDVSNSILNISKGIIPIALGLRMFAMEEVPLAYDKDGKPTKTQKIDFNKAAQTAANVMGVLAKTIIDMYQGNSKKYGVFSFILSDFERANKKVMPLIKNISETISPIAQSLYYYGRSEIPIRWDKDGRPTQYKSIDYEAAAQTAANVMGVLAKTIINIYNGEGMNKGRYYFSLSDFERANKKVIPLIKSITGILSPLAESLYYYGRSEIPVRWGKDGRPTQYKSIDYEAAAQTAANVMGVLAKTIINIYNGKGMNKGQYGFVLSDFENANKRVIPLIKSISKMLSPLAESLYYYGRSEIPVRWDKNGRPTQFKKVDYAQAAITASTILNVLPNTIVKIAKGASMQDLTEAMTFIPPLLQKIRRVLGPLGESLYLYGVQQVPIKYDANGNPKEFKKVNFVQAGITAGLVMTSILDPIGAVIDKYDWNLYNKKSEIIFNVLRTVIKDSGKLAKSLYLYGIEQVPSRIDNEGNIIESKEVNFIKASVILGSVFETLATSMKNSIELMNWDYYEKESNAMFKGLNKYIANIGKLGNVLKWYGLRQIPLAVDKDGNPTGLIEFNPEKAVQTATDVVIYLAKSFDKIIADHSKTFEKMNELKLFDTLVNLANKLLKTSIILSKVLPVNENTNNLLQALYGHTTMLNNIFDKNTVIDYAEWLIKTNTFDNIIKILSRSYSYISEISEEPFDILAEGLDKINEKIAEMPSQNMFRQHEQILSKYVKSINKIDIKKVNSLTNLINSMNILGYKMGNLDNLTKVLANQISNVLKKLTDQLAKAAETIKDAENLQKFREESIKNSIKEISGLLGQTMKVEISQSSGDTPTIPSSPSTGPTQNSETQQSGGELSGLTTLEENEYKTNKEGNTSTVDEQSEYRIKNDQRRIQTERITLSGYVIRDNKGKQIGKITKN